MNKVIYTAIFGGYDYLEIPKYVPKGFDFVCFTDTDFKSDFWEVRKVLPLYKDSTRNARKYKLLPRRDLEEYDISIWMDGIFLIRGDVNELIDKYLNVQDDEYIKYVILFTCKSKCRSSVHKTDKTCNVFSVTYPPP